MLKSFLDNGGVADWMGDTFCDDINNNEKCNYDDGDCCGFSMNYNFCIDCTCKCKLNLIRLLNCTWFFKSLVYKNDFRTWFFVHFKLDFYCLFTTQCVFRFQRKSLSLAGTWTHKQKWDKTWRNLWRSKLERNARVGIELTDFCSQTWFCVYFKLDFCKLHR